VTFTSDTDDATDNTSMLSCTAGRAVVAVDTASLAYGNQRVGTTSSSQTVNISNVGNQTLSYGVALAGASPGQFTIASGCTTSCTLGAGMSVALQIAFAPTTIGAKTAIARITPSNDPDTAMLDVGLSGTGVAPHATESPSPLAFGNVELGATSGTLMLSVQNTGTSDLTISNAGFSSGGAVYAAVGGTLGPQTTIVVAGGMTSWTIDCTPAVLNANNGNFRITSDSDAITGSILDVPLTCSGTAGVLAISPSSFDFGGVRIGDPPATKTFTLSNTGNLAVTSITAMLSSTSVGYSITAPTFPISLNPGATATVTVQFAPLQATDGGPISIVFSGMWGAGPSSTSATLSVTGTALIAGYDTNPHAFTFPDQRFDQSSTTTIDIVDTGTSAMQLRTISLVLGTAMSGDFTIVSVVHAGSTITTPPYAVTLSGSGDHAVVTVRAGPLGRVASSTATLHVHSDLPTNPDRDVPVSVTATTAILALTPAMVLDFGAVDLDAGPVTQIVTVLNTGQASLNTGLASYSGPANYKLAPSPVPAQLIASGSAFTFSVTYTPTVVMPPNNYDTGTVTIPLQGLVNGPSSVQITLRGRGTTRKMVVGPAPTFPDTFRNPGDKAPVMPVHVQNAGEATLSITGVMAHGAPAFTVDNGEPVDIPGNGAYDFEVRFAPVQPGIVSGELDLLGNDKTQPMAQIRFSGIGLDRSVDMGPAMIDLGYTGIGEPIRLSEVAPGALLHVTSMDSTTPFRIAAIGIDGDDAFSVTDLHGAPVKDVVLAPLASEQFDIVFTPATAGDFSASAMLFLDEDMTPQPPHVQVVAHALYLDAHGSGGCSAGGGAGVGTALALLALVRRRRGASLLLVAAGATASHANPPPNIDVGVFDPTPEITPTNLQVQSATVGASGDWVASAIASYAGAPAVVTAPAVSSSDATVKSRAMFVLGGAYAFLARFEVGARLPLFVQSADALDRLMVPAPSGASGTARGDLTLDAKWQLWHRAAVGGTAGIGLGAALVVPTATSNEFAGPDKPEGRLLALTTINPGLFAQRLTLNLNAGAVLRARTTYQSIRPGSGAAWGLGGSYRVLEPMWATAEVFGEALPSAHRLQNGSTNALVTVEWLAGIRYQLERRASLAIAVGRGLTNAFGTPDLRGVLALSYAPGTPALRPIRGHEGDYIDSDGDGIVDSHDKCPQQPEDKDGFQDADGCPDLDNDHDGIPDDADRCPNEPEDKDGFQDADGCPDKDNDGDGIPDDKDKCPNEPEDKDGFQDHDGCPDPDNDADGIPDAKDKCPNQAETINGFEDDDGCPDKGDSLVLMSPDRLDTLESIQFNGVKLSKASFNLLGQLAATLRAHTEVLRVRITAHVQPTSNADRDQELSVKHAIAVRDWLIQWGINGARLEARGFGGTKPLIPPNQKGAQAANDRIELIILERK
jgi:outer membrane protein OmpA-like peptidoglycan-associated protein